MEVQKAMMEGSESSESFSRKAESFVRDLRTLGVPKLPAHSSTKSDPEDIKDKNSASKNI